MSTDDTGTITRVQVDADGTCHYHQDYAAVLLVGAEEGTVIIARKTARIIARQLDHRFTVETDHGTVSAAAGDYIVTNHPDDDASSTEVWPVSRARFEGSYVTLDE